MAAAATGLSLASAGMSAFGSVSAGQTKGRNDAMAGQASFLQGMEGSMNAENAAVATDTKAIQTDDFMRQRLAGTLANITAVAASANVGTGSPSVEAIYNRTEALSDQQRATATGNLYLQANADRDSATLQQLGAYGALYQGYANQQTDEANGWMQAGGGLLKAFGGGVSSFASMFGG